MTIEVRAYTDALVSHAAETGWFSQVNSHEPKSAPKGDLSAAVWMQTLRPDQRASGLATTSAWLTFILRIYVPMLQEPQDAIDAQMIDAVDDLLRLYSADFTLDGMIREVDLLGQSGTGLSAQSGYLDIDRRKFRIIDITIPLGLNDVWDQAQ
jgi:hypothetical protein